MWWFHVEFNLISVKVTFIPSHSQFDWSANHVQHTTDLVHSPDGIKRWNHGLKKYQSWSQIIKCCCMCVDSAQQPNTTDITYIFPIMCSKCKELEIVSHWGKFCSLCSHKPQTFMWLDCDWLVWKRFHCAVLCLLCRNQLHLAVKFPCPVLCSVSCSSSLALLDTGDLTACFKSFYQWWYINYKRNTVDLLMFGNTFSQNGNLKKRNLVHKIVMICHLCRGLTERGY